MSIVLPKSMDDVEATKDFPVAPPETYEFEIKSAKQGLSQNKNVKIDLLCQIINDDEYNGIGVFETVTITEAALFRLKQLCLATGVDLEDEFDCEVFVGATFEATINIETYKNSDDEEVEKNSITKYIFDDPNAE